MPSRRRYLAAEEDLVLDEALHWGRLARPVIAALLVLAGAIAGFVLWRPAPVWFAWVLLGAVVGDALFIWSRVIGHRATRVAVTSERIVLRAGVLRRYRREIPLAALRHVTVEQRLRQRLIGAGDVVLDAGGESGRDRILGVRHPEAVRVAIDTARRALARGQALQAKPAPAGWASVEVAPVVAVDPVATRRQRLERLHAAGVISAVELAEKCAELDAPGEPAWLAAPQGAEQRLL